MPRPSGSLSAGTMTREGVRPQHLLGTLRSPGPHGIITIDDFLTMYLYILTCENACRRAGTGLTCSELVPSLATQYAYASGTAQTRSRGPGCPR